MIAMPKREHTFGKIASHVHKGVDPILIFHLEEFYQLWLDIENVLLDKRATALQGLTLTYGQTRACVEERQQQYDNTDLVQLYIISYS